MPYIYPNTEIALLKNIPLDNSYEHTLTFNTIGEQVSYFSRNVFRLLSANSYQRALNGRLRIECPMSDAVQCNYLYFRNTSFENKYFYAFITGWEYVNNITTEITYEIDVFQTFFFDLHIQPSFVEREHSNTDIIGENIVPEQLEIGDYVLLDTLSLTPYSIGGVVNANGCAIFLTTFNDDTDLTDYQGGFLNFVYSGLNVIKKDSVNEIQSFLNKVIEKGKIDGIVSSFMCPFSPVAIQNIGTYTWTYSIPKNYYSLDGYTPKNNKLFTAPYYTARLRNDSDIEEYPMEYFSGNTMQFDLLGTIIPEPTLTMRPKNFAENLYIGTHYPRNDLRQVCKAYPQVAWNSDVFKVYLAQNAGSLVTGMISTVQKTGFNVLSNLINPISPNVVGAVGNVVDLSNQIWQTLGQMRDISIKPPQLNGSQTALSDYAVGAKNFYVDVLSIREEFAKIIDGYFSMFGYATHEVKIPNITGRPHWNYVKTKGVVLNVANAPQPYVQKIQACLNRGITFWHNPAEVGNYSLDNRPV